MQVSLRKLVSGKKQVKRALLALFVFLLCVALVLPNGFVFAGSTQSTLQSAITNWTGSGGSYTTTDNGYKLANNGGNNFLISDQYATSFSFESDITITGGDRATLAFGLSSSKAPGDIWHGVELKKTGSTTGEIKAFIVDSPDTVAPIALTNLDWTKPVHCKAEMGEDKTLTLSVNGQVVGTGSDPTFESGYMGLLVWNSEALFNNIGYTGHAAAGNAVSDITSWSSINGTITNGQDGYSVARNPKGDDIAVSDKNTSSFTYESDIKILDGEGQRATLAYNIAGETSMGSVWRGAELMKTSDTAGQLRVFNVATGGSNIIGPVSLTGMDWTKPVKVKLTMDDSKKLTVYVNGNKVGETTDDGYVSGYVGIVSWKTKAVFNNIRLLNTPVASNFYTNLNNLTPLNGTWNETLNGMYSNGGGDNFALAGNTGTDFIYEADVQFQQQKGAASLIFLSSDTPNQNSYCANIDLNAKNARIFKFGGGTLGEYKLPASMQNKTNFTLRVEVIGRSMNYYINGVLVVSYVDQSKTASTSGRFGLLTYDTTVTYQNVNVTPLNDTNLPELASLDVAGSEIKPGFDAKTYGYAAKVPFDATSVTVNTGAGSGSSAVVSAFDSDAAPLAVVSDGGAATIPFTGDACTAIVTVQKADIAVSYGISLTRIADPSTLYTEKYRPQLHFSPLKNWMNDPNGLVYDPSNQTYNMFYQYNPFGLNIANQVWGHAVSTDLVHWTQADDVAINQDSLGAVFSGSCVVDENNTSGFFTDNQPGESKLVAFYTSDGGDTSKGVEKQSLAYSKDHGHTWIKPTVSANGFDNPVISNENNKYGRDFRDPKVFWYDGKWMMVVAGGHARLFTSSDLIHWNLAGDLGMDSECPDLYQLPVDGNTNNMKWVYSAAGSWYVIGDLQRDAVVDDVQHYKFVAQTDHLKYNGDPDAYATTTYYNDGSNQNRRLAVSWLRDDTAGALGAEGKVWNGVQSLPYETGIKTVNGKLQLTSYPLEEINGQRAATPMYSATNRQVDASAPNILAGVAGTKYDIEATFTPGEATQFGFKLRQGVGQETVVQYNKNLNQFILDRNKSGKAVGGIQDMQLSPMPDGKIKMRVIVDTSVIEAFGNDGEAAISDLFFPDPTSVGLEFFTNGSLTVDSMTVYEMESIWRDDLSGGTEATQICLSTPDTNVEVGKQLVVNANILPSAAANKKVTWSVADPSVFSTVSQTDTSITLKALKEGSSAITATVQGSDLSGAVTLTAIPNTFSSDLSGWYGVTGTWSKNSDGYHTDGTGGDSFAFSDTVTKSFVYEGDVMPKEGGGCPGLIFGVSNPLNPSSGTWFGANIDTNGNGDATAKLFQNTNNSEVWHVTHAVAKTGGTYHLKVEVSAKGHIDYWVNETLVAQKDMDVPAGTLGLISWNSSATFNNIQYTALEPVRLTGIQLSDGTLTPDFSSDVQSYDVTVPYSTDSIRVKPAVGGTGTITVNGAAVNSGEFSGDIALSVGSNTVQIVAAGATSDDVVTVTLHIVRQAQETGSTSATATESTTGGNDTTTGSSSNITTTDNGSTGNNTTNGGSVSTSGKDSTDGNPTTGDSVGIEVALFIAALLAAGLYLLSNKGLIFKKR